MEDKTRLQKAEREVRDAEDRYKNAHMVEDAARKDSTQALNILNAAQKLFDAIVEGMKKTEAYDSKWGMEKREGRKP